MSMHIPDKTIFTPTACIPVNQLQRYALHQLNTGETRKIEEHLADCELCSLAVDGFLASPVTVADIHELNSRIDKATGSQWFNGIGKPIWLGLTLVGIGAASVLFYVNRNKGEDNQSVKSLSKEITSVKTDTKEINPVVQPGSVPDQEIKPVVQNTNAGNAANENFMEQTAVPVKSSNPQKEDGDKSSLSFSPDNFTNSNSVQNPRNPILSNSSQNPNTTNPQPKFTPDDLYFKPEYNSPVQYVNGLKVSDYEKLYFMNPGQLQPRDIPAPQEGRSPSENNLYMRESDRTVTAESELKKGLAFFKSKDFGKANAKFLELLELNSEDINARFYYGVACYNLDRPDKCIASLDKVLAMKNNAFREEALWYKALALIMQKNLSAAKEVLQKIADEHGFYAKQARDKMKELKL